MYEFLTVVDAMHDDPTIFPTLSAPHDALPFQWEAADGDAPLLVTTSKQIGVWQYTGNGWTQMRRFKDLTFTVVVTQARIVVYCEKFTKGGGWWGFGAGGLAVALVANAVSHARAAARRKGKLLVGQVRFDWLTQVSAPVDTRGRQRSIRCMVDAGGRPLALDISLGDRDDPLNLAAHLARAAAARRLVAQRELTTAQLDQLHVEVSGATVAVEHDLPGASTVGALAGPTPAMVADPRPEPARAELPTVQPMSPKPSSVNAHAASEQCAACGNALLAGSPTCGRCGHTVSPALSPRPSAQAAPNGNAKPGPEATISRSSLAASATALVESPAQPPTYAEATIHRLAQHSEAWPTHSPMNQPPEGEWGPPPPVAPVPWPPPAGRDAVPPQIWLVGAGLVALAGFLLYPVVRYGFPLLPNVYASDAFTRAFAALALDLFAILAACGVALLLLAIGLVRGSRVAQLLTCFVCAVVSISILVSLQSDTYSAGLNSSTTAVVVLLISIAVIILITVTPGVSAFFAGDTRPVGVEIACAVSAYLAWVAVLDATLLMLSGALAVKLVWIGACVGAVGVVLIAVGGPLRRGSSAARLLTVTAFVALIAALLLLAADVHDFGSVSTLLPVGVIAVGLIGLTIPQPSRDLFNGARPAGASPSPLRLMASGIAVALLIAAGGIGFYAAHHDSDSYYYGASDEASPDDSTGSYATSPVAMTQDDAVAVADGTMEALEGAGSIETCDGSELPDLAVSQYTIDEVSPQTSGTFDVTADVELDNGSHESVSYAVGSDSTGTPCVDSSSFTEEIVSQPSQPTSPSPSATISIPSDVPVVATRSEPVPGNAALPARPQPAGITSYRDGRVVPTSSAQIVEYQPDGLDQAQADAVRSVIGFMTQINRQDFQAAWQLTTYRLAGPNHTFSFALGWRTSRYYQAAFGQPKELGDGLMIVPARWVSRQSGAAQHADVPSCTYWPQYMFVLAHRQGHWRVDVSGRYTSNALVLPHERYSSEGLLRPNPINQRVTC